MLSREKQSSISKNNIDETQFIFLISGIEHKNHEASPNVRSRRIFCLDPDQPMTPR